MANVLLLNASGIIAEKQYVSSCYYEGLTNVLTEAGNNVMHIITNDFVVLPFNGDNQPVSEFQKEKLFQQIKIFNPDLIISFNHSSIEGLDKLVDCPFAVWEADTVAFFSGKDYLKKNIDRFHFVAISSATAEDFKNILSANPKRIIKVQPATAIINQREEKRYNISFIGNGFLNQPETIKVLQKYPNIIDLPLDQIADIVKPYFISPEKIKFAFTGFKRASIICALGEHGIKLFGGSEWRQLEFISENLIHAYDPRLVYSLTHNQLIYNRSKISLNISHTQAKSGYSWRVADIMASSATLLSNYSSDLEKAFPKIKLPFYHSVSEAADLAKKLLADAPWRKDLMLACNDAIEKNGRWSDCLKQISDFTGVKLSHSKQQGSYYRAIPEFTRFETYVNYIAKHNVPSQKKVDRDIKNRKANIRLTISKNIKRILKAVLPPLRKSYRQYRYYYAKHHSFKLAQKNNQTYN